MTGLKITLNDKKLSASIENGNLNVIISQVSQPEQKTISNLYFGGVNKNSKQRVEWYNSKLHSGDKIIIEVQDVQNISYPISSKKFDNNLMRRKDNHNKLIYFKNLEKELKDKRLI